MLNNVIIQGRMTRDAELRQTNGGVSVTSFTLAVDRDKKEPDGTRKTDFIDCTAWRQTAEYICKYGGKGRMTVVEGKLHFRDWTDKEGNNRRATEVVADNVYLVDSKREVPGYDAETASTGFQDIDEDGEIPF